MEVATERTLLISKDKNNIHGLTVIFAIICIVDVFGVFPIVALPKAVIDCGYYGIVIIILVCSLQIYTAILLGRCWIIAEAINPKIKKKSRYPFAALAEITYGNKLAIFVTFLLDLTIFGGGIPNLIVASQNLELFGLRITDNKFNFSFCYWIIILGTALCPILWLGSPKDMKLICTLSVILVTSVFLLILICLIFGGESQVPIRKNIDQPLWLSLFSAYGIIAFQFDIHPSILTIQVDMIDKNKLNQAVLGGFSISILYFAIITITTASIYGSNTNSSILETLPATPALHLAAILVALQLCFTSAVSNSALYQHLEQCLNISREFNHKRCILRTILTLMAIVIAESVPRFDLVMSLIGGTLTGPLVFILPPLFYIKLLYLEDKHVQQLALKSFKLPSTGTSDNDSDEENNFQDNIDIIVRLKSGISNKLIWTNVEIVFCALLIIISTFMTLFTTYLSISNAVTSSNFSQPCIYNITKRLLYL